jgi:hypothetical protein
MTHNNHSRETSQLYSTKYTITGQPQITTLPETGIL